jgi:hypothetical protein
MKEITKITRSELVAVFDHWVKDFIDNGEWFGSSYDGDYAESCADYFIETLDSLRATQKPDQPRL